MGNPFDALLAAVGVEYEPGADEAPLNKSTTPEEPAAADEVGDEIFEAPLLLKSTDPLASKDGFVVIERASDHAIADMIESGTIGPSWSPRGTGARPLSGRSW